MNEMTEAVNGFGFELFHRIADIKDNLFISPSSLAIALAMTAQGAEGDTESAILSTLGLKGIGKAEAAQYFRSLLHSLQEADEKCSLETANSIWVHNTLSILDSFAGQCRDLFDASAATRDLDKEETVEEINAWCAEKTHGKIDSIIDRFEGDIVMALLNALYFKGSWAFEWNWTKESLFHGIDQKDREVRMMYATDYMAFAENDQFEALELPYGNGSFVLDILMPKDKDGFGTATAVLDGKSWTSLCEGFSTENVSFAIPQFKVENDIEMTEPLKVMGMAVAFGDGADFSAMSDSPLRMGLVKQKTFVDINEKGTEAAAISFIGMKNMALGPSQDEPRKFIADRPFIFIIRERHSGSVLFIGRKTI